MNNKVNPSVDAEVLAAFGKGASSLTKVASGAVGLTAIAYVMGWAKAQKYFSTFGASWIIRHLEPLDILTYSLVPCTLLAFGIVTTVLILANQSMKRETLWKIASIIFCLLFFSQIAVLLTSRFSIVNSLYTAIVPGLLNIGASIMIGLLFTLMGQEDFKWESPVVIVLVSAIYYAIWAIPSNIGKFEGTLAISSNLKGMPIVRLHDQSLEWHLLTSSGDSYIVVNISTTSQNPEFKVVGRKSITAIQALLTK